MSIICHIIVHHQIALRCTISIIKSVYSIKNIKLLYIEFLEIKYLLLNFEK